MPGLRSLVARRRSSLTSPPYTVQRNTPSPSLSDTSDHAATPHHSEGGESPMTERGGVGEEQEPQGQDASDVQGQEAGGSTTQGAQSTQSVNGEESEKGDVCSSVSMGNTEQEKGLLDANEVKDPGGKPHASTTSEICISEEKKSSPASGVCAGSFLTGVHSEQTRVVTTVCENSEQIAEEIWPTLDAVTSEEQKHMGNEPSHPESYIVPQGAEPVISEETSVHKEECLEKEETPVVKEFVEKDETLFPVGEESQENVEGCYGDAKKLIETYFSDTDVRLGAENWDTSGGFGDGAEKTEHTGGVCLTSVEGEIQETGESHIPTVNLYRDFTAIPEENYAGLVEEGANEKVRPMDTAEDSDYEKTEPAGATQEIDGRVTESVCESDETPTENIETFMDGEETQVPGTREGLELEKIVDDPVKHEEFSQFGVNDGAEYLTGRGDEENIEAALCDDGGTTGREIEPGEGGCGGGNGGRAGLEQDGIGCLAGNERIEEGEGSCSTGTEVSETNMNDSKGLRNVEDETNTNDRELPSENVYIEDGRNYPGAENVGTTGKIKIADENEDERDSARESRREGDSTDAICKGETPPSSEKAGGSSETPPSSSDNKNVLSKLNPKNIKGGKKCSDLSATEIESTLASRGVTIVRRVVDNKESGSRGTELSNTIKKEGTTSIKPVGKVVFTKTLQPSTASGSGISVSLQPSLPGQANSPTPKELYKSINARGTNIQTSSKINPALLNRKGSFQLTRGVSIHYNPKSAATNMNVKGNTVYPNPRGGIGVGSRGPRMYANPRIPGPQTPRGFPANMRPRGAVLPQIRRGTQQTNLRGPLTPVNTRGMPRAQRYTGPRGAVPRASMPQPRGASVTTGLRGVAPQRLRGGISQHQPRLPGLPQVRPTEGVMTQKAGDNMQLRCTTAPPQAKYLKTSPDSRPGDAALQSKFHPDKFNMSLQNKGAGISTQLRPDTLHSPQPGSGEVSPQSLMSGIQPQSEFGGPSTQPRAMDQSPQSVLAMSSASSTSQTGPVSFTSQPASASHPTLPSSSHHLPQMNLMDHSPQTNAMGLPPHTGASRLPPHSSGGFLGQPGTLGSSSQPHISSHMGASDRFSSNIAPAGFPTIPSSEYLGRPGSEMFPSYSNPGEYTPHSTANEFPHLNSGNFGLQSTSGGFHAQTNLVGFPAQNDPCGYPQHAGSSEFPPHNSGGVVRQTGSDTFPSHPNCSNFPVPSNPGTYPPIPCSEPYSTPTNPGTFRDNAALFSYPGQREFMMHSGSREFPQFSSSNQMTNQIQPLPATGHSDLPMSQSPRDIPLQNCNQAISMPSTSGNSSMNNIIGDQFSSFGEPLGHPTYQEIPGSARTSTNTVPLAPNYRETNVQHNFRDSATPQYNSYRESTPQEGLRTPQMHSAYRDLPLDPNIDLQAQGAHSSFKDQQSTRYPEDGIISRYLEESGLSYPEAGNINSCREQPVPNFGSPASHTSPSEQGMSSCRENINQINFPETINDTSSRQQQHLMPGLGEPLSYGSYRGPMEFSRACEPPNPSLQEPLTYVPECRDASNNPVTKSVTDSMYKDHVPVSSYNVNSHHLSLEGIQNEMKFKEKNLNYETPLLPSFTESFDHSTSEIGGKKGGSSNLPHYRGSGVSYQRNLPEYTNPATPFENHGQDASTSYSCLGDSKNAGARESPLYSGQGGYATPSCDPYSPAQSCSPDQQYIGGSGHNFHAKSDFHIPGDSLVPPDKGILEFPISQGSSTVTSTNSTQSDPSGRRVPDSSVPNPETNISSSKVSTSVNHIEKNVEQKFAMVGSHKDGKKCERSNFFGSSIDTGLAKNPGSNSPTKSPGSRSVGSPGKFPVGMSPSKSDTGSPSTQDRIVIKMKLLHSSSSAEEDTHSAENSITELGPADKSSFKYSLAKYTCWTIDSIINGREDLGTEEILDQDNDCENEKCNEKGGKVSSMTDSSPKSQKKISSEICEDSKDTNLDTNKNLMKKSLKITITNPLRNKVPRENYISNDKKVEVKHDAVALGTEDADNVSMKMRDSPKQEPEGQLQCSFKKGKVKLGKSSPIPSTESCNSSTGGLQPGSERRRCGRGSEASPGGDLCSAANDHLVTSEVKKCSIVIKRIYKNDNYSCYSSSLCDKKTVLNIDDGTQRRSKRRAAMEASERCHKTLRSLDAVELKSGKVSLAGVMNKNKDILSVNLTTNKSIISQIPQCSVLLYDVFMNHRINQMVCPGCSRHYDSSDSVQVNMNKATISLLCSSCQWLVVKDVHPQEVDSLVPS